MYLTRLNLMYSVIIILLCVYLTHYSAGGKVSHDIVYLDHIEWCKDPDPPYPKVMHIFADTEIRDKFDISGNISITTEIPVLNVSARVFAKDKKTKSYKSVFAISKMDCQNIFASGYIVMLNIKYNGKNCNLIKGNYNFTKFNFNKIAKLGLKWLNQGVYRLRIQLTNDNITDYCQESNMIIEKAG